MFGPLFPFLAIAFLWNSYIDLKWSSKWYGLSSVCAVTGCKLLLENKKWYHNYYFFIWIAFNCYFVAHQSHFDLCIGTQQDRRDSTPSPPLTTEAPWASCWCMTSPIPKPLKTSPSGYGILMRWDQCFVVV